MKRKSGPLHGQCNYITQHKRIYINIGMKKRSKEEKIKEEYNVQYSIDLINNNIIRDVQEEYANRLYRVCTHSSNMDDENSEYLTDN